MIYPEGDPDAAVRLAAFAELERLTAVRGPVLAWDEIAPGFVLPDGDQVLFANRARGIFRPTRMRGAALSIKTTVPRAGRSARYDDKEGNSGEFHYRLQGGDPARFDNEWLRVAFERQWPLIYFVGVAEGMYRPLWPVFVTGWHPERLSVTIQADDRTAVRASSLAEAADSTYERVRRAYVTVLAKRRLHQDVFRENVLSAYSDKCAVCRMPRRELLDAAHIVPDSDPDGGDPVVNNGLSLCKLHHAAFDADLLGITPELTILLSNRLLSAVDGPTLEFGLKSFHRKSLERPRDRRHWPDRDRLRRRFDRFEITAKAG